jgi:hypothetical protein
MNKRKRNRNFWGTVVLLIWLPTAVDCQSDNKNKHPIETGEYDYGLKIGYDESNNKLSGLLDISDVSKKVSCKLLLVGNYKSGSDSIIKIYFIDPLSFDKIDSGVLKTSKGFVTIKSISQITFCQNIIDLHSGQRFNLIEKKKIISCDVVKPEKSYILTTSDRSAKSKKYLIRGDLISVLSRQDDYFNIEFQGKKLITGWIKKDDLLFGSNASN